jgi:hypothetical protein
MDETGTLTSLKQNKIVARMGVKRGGTVTIEIESEEVLTSLVPALSGLRNILSRV